MASLPYIARPGQDELVAAIQATQADGGHLVVEAGTGMGKTICALTASATTTAADRRRVVYATRTNSQQTQVVREHAALQVDGTERGMLIPLMGRRHYCPLLRSDERFKDGSPEELSRLCRDAKAKARREVATDQPVEGACPFYARLLRDGVAPVEALLSEGGLDGGQLASRIEAAGSCPYEALKLLLPRAQTIVVPYIYILDDRMRSSLLQWLGVGADECHLVVDEAHNLPQAARDHHSPRLTLGTLQRAQKEAEEFHDPTLAGTTLATTVLDAIIRALYGLVDEHVHGGEDGLVPPGALDEALLTTLRLPTPHLARITRDLQTWGESIREDRRAKGRLPRSYLGAVGDFLAGVALQRDAPHVHLVTAGDNPALELFLLDPAAVLGWLGEFWSTVQMSGTLAPLEEQRNVCGLDVARTRTLRLATPFDPDNLRLYGLEGVHRRYQAVLDDPQLTVRQQETAREVLAGWRGRTGLFFPSHQMMRDYIEEGFLHGVERPFYVETPDLSTPELARLVAAFRSDVRPGALLLGVLGGRLTEGLDFPGETLEHLVLFGVPYPRPSARSQALIHHYDARGGNGWQVAVHTPVGRVLRQAVGRIIRGPDDKGSCMVLDERVVRFHNHLPDLRMVRSVAEALAGPPPGTPARPQGFTAASSEPLLKRI